MFQYENILTENLSDGFGLIARVTEFMWMLSCLMQIWIKAAFTQTQHGQNDIFVPRWVKKFYFRENISLYRSIVPSGWPHFPSYAAIYQITCL